MKNRRKMPVLLFLLRELLNGVFADQQSQSFNVPELFGPFGDYSREPPVREGLRPSLGPIKVNEDDNHVVSHDALDYVFEKGNSIFGNPEYPARFDQDEERDWLLGDVLLELLSRDRR